MLDWLLLTAGGAAMYAASKWFTHSRRKNRAAQQKTGKYGQPLKLVVAQCEARWFLQDLKWAMSGDAEAMVRVSHMLMAGYGTKQDHAAAAAWMRQAWAIQNYKEPALMHDMLDIRESDIPALNEAKSAVHGTGKGAQEVQAADSSSSSSSSSNNSSSSSSGGNGSVQPHSVDGAPMGPSVAATCGSSHASAHRAMHDASRQCDSSPPLRDSNSSANVQERSWVSQAPQQLEQQLHQQQRECTSSVQCKQQQQQQQQPSTASQLGRMKKQLVHKTKQRLHAQRLAAAVGAAAACLGTQEQQPAAVALATASPRL